MARKAKTIDDDETYATAIMARCTVGGRARVDARAAFCNMSRSDFVREIAEHGQIIVKQSNTLSDSDRHELSRLIIQFSKAGNNLNQAVHRLNASGNPERAEVIEALLPELYAFIDRARALLDRAEPSP